MTSLRFAPRVSSLIGLAACSLLLVSAGGRGLSEPSPNPVPGPVVSTITSSEVLLPRTTVTISDSEAFGATPTAVVLDDFTGDGRIDLLSTWRRGENGFVELRPGREGVSFRTHVGASAVFGEPNRFPLPVTPVHVAAGDFDGDGHSDLVVADSQTPVLHLVAGTGDGDFGESRARALPGVVTAMVAGDINRPDRMDDLALAVSEESAETLVVLEDGRGAFDASPESIPLASPVLDLVTGRFNDDPYGDVAAHSEAGIELAFGRNRRLTYPEGIRPPVRPPRHQRIRLPGVVGIAAGNLAGPYGDELAVLQRSGQLTVLDLRAGGRRRVHFPVPDGGPATWGDEAILLVARASVYPHDDLIVSDAGSAMAYVLHERHLGPIAGPNSVLEGAGWLPEPVAEPVRIKSAAPVLIGAAARLNADAADDLVLVTTNGLELALTAPRSTYRVNQVDDAPYDGLCDAHCTLRDAIELVNAGGTGGSMIAFDVASIGPATAGPLPFIGPSVTISGGDSPSTRIVMQTGLGLGGGMSAVSGIHATDLFVDGGSNTVTNCRLGNLTIGGDGNIVGGSQESQRNVIDSQLTIGAGFNVSSGNQVVGNHVGVDEEGNAATAGGGQIRDDNRGQNNQFIDNVASKGISLYGAVGAIIQKNHLGIGRDGETGLNAQFSGGVALQGESTENTIGGSSADLGNVLSGLSSDPVNIFRSDDNEVLYNLIGTNAAANQRVENQSTGIRNSGRRNLIRNNVIAGGRSYGIVHASVDGSDSLYVVDNCIGAMGFACDRPLGNDLGGVQLESTRAFVLGNTITANGGHGIEVHDYSISADASEHVISGNRIGLLARRPCSPEATCAAGNDGDGIHIDGGASGVWIGEGSSATSPNLYGNWIAGNTGSGIFIADDLNAQSQYSTGIRITGNSIFDNVGLGIEFEYNAAMPVRDNDPFDLDAGPNGLQNRPFVLYDPVTEVATVSLSSSGDAAGYIIELFDNEECDPTGYGEGQRFLDRSEGEPDVDGRLTVEFHAVEGEVLTATATSLPVEETSDFSLCSVSAENLQLTKGILLDPENPSRRDPDAWLYTGLGVTGVGFSGVQNVVFDPEIEATAFDFISGDNYLTFDLEVESVEDVFGEYDLKLVFDDHMELNLSEIVEYKFEVVQADIAINQALDTHRLPQGYEETLVGGRHIALLLATNDARFDAEHDGEVWNPKLWFFGTPLNVEPSRTTSITANKDDELWDDGQYHGLVALQSDAVAPSGSHPVSCALNSEDSGFSLHCPEYTFEFFESRSLRAHHLAYDIEESTRQPTATRRMIELQAERVYEIYPFSADRFKPTVHAVAPLPSDLSVTTAEAGGAGSYRILTTRGGRDLLRKLRRYRQVIAEVTPADVLFAHLPYGLLFRDVDADGNIDQYSTSFVDPDGCVVLLADNALPGSERENPGPFGWTHDWAVAHNLGHVLLRCLPDAPVRTTKTFLGDTYPGGRLHCPVNPADPSVVGLGNSRCPGERDVLVYGGFGSYGGTRYMSGSHFEVHDFMHDGLGGTGSRIRTNFVNGATYARLMDVLVPYGAQGRMTGSALSDVVQVMGLVHEDGHGSLDDLEVAPGEPAPASTTGTHAVQLRDMSEAVLSEYRFDPDYLFLGEPPTVMPFASFGVDLDLAAGARYVVLVDGATELARRSISSNAPTVSITSPAQGSFVGEGLTLEWSADDLDGDPLTYSVLFEPEPDSVIVLAVLLDSPFFAVPADVLPPLSSVRFTLVASDGLNEGSASVLVNTVAIGVEDLVEVPPVEPLLVGAYPNPASGHVRLTYRLPDGSEGWLRIHDSLGREVANRRVGPHPPGRRDAAFTVTDYPPGVYFVTLRAGGRSSTRTVVLVR